MERVRAHVGQDCAGGIEPIGQRLHVDAASRILTATTPRQPATRRGAADTGDRADAGRHTLEQLRRKAARPNCTDADVEDHGRLRGGPMGIRQRHVGPMYQPTRE